jgi:hypothetical protein
MKQVALRIVPFLMVCYFVSFVDRVNLGFAALQMVKDLHLSPTVFGFGGGIFFVSYFLCEVPSNLFLEKFGARRWLARIMITWGMLAGGMALVKGPQSLYAGKGPAWAVSTEWLSAGTAAAGLAQINAISNLAGFGTTYVMGFIKDATGKFTLALVPLVALATAAALAILWIGRVEIPGQRMLSAKT